MGPVSREGARSPPMRFASVPTPQGMGWWQMHRLVACVAYREAGEPAGDGVAVRFFGFTPTTSLVGAWSVRNQVRTGCATRARDTSGSGLEMTVGEREDLRPTSVSPITCDRLRLSPRLGASTGRCCPTPGGEGSKSPCSVSAWRSSNSSPHSADGRSPERDRGAGTAPGGGGGREPDPPQSEPSRAPL